MTTHLKKNGSTTVVGADSKIDGNLPAQHRQTPSEASGASVAMEPTLTTYNVTYLDDFETRVLTVEAHSEDEALRLADEEAGEYWATEALEVWVAPVD